jgi:hypothetical protein
MKRILLIVIAFLIALSSCSKNGDSAPTTSVPVEDSDIVISQTENEIILRNKANWMTDGLKAVGLVEFTQSQVEEGNLQTANGSDKYRGIILSEFYDKTARKSYLAVELKDKVIIRPFVEDVEVTYADIIYLRDIDGDKTDDIIMQSTVGMTGGAGQYASQVYRVTEDGIEQVFFNSSKDPYYTNYTGVISSDCKMTIYNPAFLHDVQFDYPNKQLVNELLSENENPNVNEVLYADVQVDSDKEFVPVHIYGDGIYEIECEQYTSFFGHTDYVGDLKTVLKYNAETNSFDIVYSWFETKDSNKTFSVEDYEWYIENFPASGNIGDIQDEEFLIETAKELWNEKYGVIQGQVQDPTGGCEVKVFYDESYDYWLVQGTLPPYSTGMVPFLIVSGNGDLIAIGLR